MATLTTETARSGSEWFPTTDPSVAGSARRAAMRLAARLGFDETRAGDVGIVATEMATNLCRHAIDGAVCIQVALRDGRPGVQIVAIDRGPGIADLLDLSADGRSTAGTLGIGLGAIARLAHFVDVSSDIGVGTVLVADLWPGDPPALPDVDVGGTTRAMAGELECGDAIAGREVGNYHMLALADGLGHGPLAAAAAREAIKVFHESDSTGSLETLMAMHRKLGHTRGAAVAVASIDPGFRRLTLAGLGNVSAFVVGPDRRQALHSYPGIVGHKATTVRQLDMELADGATIVMHSDGVRESWDLALVPGLARRSSAVIAASILRDAGGRRDDASVIVARRR